MGECLNCKKPVMGHILCRECMKEVGVNQHRKINIRRRKCSAQTK